MSFFFLLSHSFGQKYDAELVDHKTAVYVKSGKLNKTISYEIRINNKAGNKYAYVSIPYSKLIKVSKVEGYVKDASGNIVRKLKSSEIIERSNISGEMFYTDDLEKIFELTHETYPYTIFYEYQELQDEFVSLEFWIPVLDDDVPTLKATLDLEVPADYKFSYRSRFVNDPQINHNGNLTAYSWSAKYDNPTEDEVLAPPIINFCPNVRIVPENFRFETEGSYKDWKSMGNWQHSLITNLSDLPATEKENIKLLVDGIENRKEKIRKLFHQLQDETRYIYISTETGGLKPFPASYVLKNKYGDCKALSNYFKSILESIGIPAYYTTIHADPVLRSIDRSMPSQQFNHVILCVPLDGDTLWLDPTSDNPMGYVGTFIQNRDVFVINKDQSFLSKTPALTKNDVIETRSANISMHDNKQVIAVFKNNYKGDGFEMLFSLLNGFNETNRSRIIGEQFSINGFEVIDYKLEKPHRDSTSIGFSYSAKSLKLYNAYGNDMLISLVPFNLPDLKDPSKRKLPVQFNYPFYGIDTLEYSIPVEYKLLDLPQPENIINEFGEYKLEFIQSGGKVRVFKELLINAGYYELNKYKDLYAFLKKVKDMEKNTYIVTVKQF